MYRYIILFAVILLIIAGIAGFVVLSHPNNPAPANLPSFEPQTIPNPTPPANRSKEDIQSAFQNEIAPYNNDNVKMHETVTSGDYALQVWIGNNTGGEALLKYDSAQGRWVVLSGGGGAWSVGSLVAAGVPKDTAAILLTGAPH